jgi:Zn/Cd-binding protein ZinT
MLYILVALLITAIVGYCVETIKMKITIERVKRTSREMTGLIDDLVVGVEDIDMFLINTIRQKIKTKYVKPGRIDEFRIYKNGNRRIRLAFRVKQAVQKIDIYIGRSYHRTEEISLDYFDDMNASEAL